MPEDGIVGDRTWRALFKKSPVDMPQLSVGYRGSEVAPMNLRLGLNGFRSVRTFNQEYKGQRLEPRWYRW
jgi:hypothetical protein